MTYDQRVRAIAEEMALVKYAESLAIYSHISHNEYLKRKKEGIELMLPCARIAVKKMAYSVYVLLTMLKWDTNDIAEYMADGGYLPNKVGALSDLIDEWKEQGLIPDNAQEGANDAIM